jgi:hypothetical protein
MQVLESTIVGNEMLYTEKEIYEDRDHRSHVQDFYNYVAYQLGYGYGSDEWLEICKIQ